MAEKLIFILFALFIAIDSLIIDADLVAFRAFKTKYGKKYKDQAEEDKRYAIFKDNRKIIVNHNEVLYLQNLSSYEMGVTQFTDLTPEEFKKNLTYQNPGELPAKSASFSVRTEPPESKDWRDEGVVSNVKDQGYCGASWTFAATGAIEAANAIKSGTNVTTPNLSEQQIIDCAQMYNNGGCQGGSLNGTYAYISDKGLETESDYGYINGDGFCVYDSSKVAVQLKSFDSFHGSEDDLKQAVGNTGPVSVAIDASDLQNYARGIYNGNCSATEINEAALVVGYGNENGIDYWIVKNSWGTKWGEDGYFRILRGSNKCGISQDCYLPTDISTS